MKQGNNIFKISLLFLGLILLFSFSVNTVSAAHSTTYVSTSGNNTWNGYSPNYNYTNGWGPKDTIANAIGNTAVNGTIYVEPGTYEMSNTLINKNLTIIGESLENGHVNPIIDGSPVGGVFTVANGVTVTIDNLTFNDNGYYQTNGGAIYNNGGLTLNNCIFTYNLAGGNSGSSDNVYKTCGGAIYNTGKLTINNNGFTENIADSGGAIYNTGTLIVTNSSFTNCSTFSSDGGAIDSESGTLTISKCSFTNNTAVGFGGAVEVNNGLLTVTNSIFTKNSASVGGAINHYGPFTNTGTIMNDLFINNIAGDGGAINGLNNLTISNSTFISNSAGSGGAIDYGTQVMQTKYDKLSITKSTFINNRASEGAAIENDESFANITQCIFTNNSYITDSIIKNPAIYNYGGTVNITGSVINEPQGFFIETYDEYDDIHGIAYIDGNWWGINKPSNNLTGWVVTGYATSWYYNETTWLVLNITSDKSSIFYHGNSIVKATLMLYNNTNNTYSPVTSCAPVTVSFNALNGNMNPRVATLTPETVNGNVMDQATSLFTPYNTGSFIIDANVNNQNVRTNIMVNQLPFINVGNVKGYYGENSNLIAYLKDNNNSPVIGEVISFQLNGNTVGSAVTNSEGLAFYPYNLNLSPGKYNITTSLEGIKLNSTGILSIALNPTNLTVNNFSNYAGHNVELNAFINDNNNKPVNKGSVIFKVNNSIVGTVDVVNGQAIHSWMIPIKYTPGIYIVQAYYNGVGYYGASNSTGNLTIDPTPIINPLNGTVNIPRDTLITINFTQPVKMGNMKIQLIGSNGSIIPLDVTFYNNQITLKPVKLLNYNTKYTLILSTGYVTYNNSLLPLWNSTFTTIPIRLI